MGGLGGTRSRATAVVTRLRSTAFTLARSAVVGETLTRRRGSRRPTTRPAETRHPSVGSRAPLARRSQRHPSVGASDPLARNLPNLPNLFLVGRRDPRRRVSVSPTTAERAKINAVGRNRVTADVRTSIGASLTTGIRCGRIRRAPSSSSACGSRARSGRFSSGPSCADAARDAGTPPLYTARSLAETASPEDV